MAWPTGDEIVSQLPLGGKGVTPDEADDRIRRWKAKLEFEPDPKNSRQKALAEEVVSTGVEADMQRLQLRRAGRIETPDADALRKEANELLKAYNALRYTMGEEPEEAPTAPATVSNVTPEPLWSDWS